MVQFIFRDSPKPMPAISTQLRTGPKRGRPAKETIPTPKTLTNEQRAKIIADKAATKPHDLWFSVYNCALKQLESKDAGYRLKGEM